MYLMSKKLPKSSRERLSNSPGNSFLFICGKCHNQRRTMSYSNKSVYQATISSREVLAIVDTLLPQGVEHSQLSDMQSIVLRDTWEDRSYQQIADDLGYQVDYIRQVASQLWRLLSIAIGEKVSKKNLHSVLRRYQLHHPLMIHSTDSEIVLGIQDWGEAIDVSIFYGRHAELTKLEQWIAWNHCRLVGIYGWSGMGKTTFAIKLAQKLESQFDYVIWRSLQSAPELPVLCTDILTVLIGADTAIAPELAGSLLIQQLQEKRCLLIFDDVDAMLPSGDSSEPTPSQQDYQQLFDRIATVNHQSCLLIAASERPASLERWDGENSPVRSINLPGLSGPAGRQILADKGLAISHSALEPDTLIEHLGGNPLALKIAATKIHNLFDSDLRAFLAQGHTIFSDLWELFDREFQRLSAPQRSLLYWIAIDRRGCQIQRLQEATQLPMREVLTALETLHQRSWIKSTPQGLTTQQPAVTEYVRARFRPND
jgi:ATPase family associated with various cellular activities (AAA)